MGKELIMIRERYSSNNKQVLPIYINIERIHLNWDRRKTNEASEFW